MPDSPAQPPQPHATPMRSTPAPGARAGRRLDAEAILYWAAGRAWLLLLWGAGRLVFPGTYARNVTRLWDAGWQLGIAAHGYAYDPHGGGAQNVAFFPLWPLTIRAARAVTGANPAIAAAVMASLFFGAALVLFNRWMAGFMEPRARRLGLFLLSFFPAGVYFSLPYAESAFLFVTLGMFVLSESGRPWPAAACGVLAGLARPNGWIAGVAMLAAQWGRDRRAARQPAWLVIGASGFVGAGAFFLYCWIGLGDPLAPIHVQAAWDHRPLGFLPTYVAKMLALAKHGRSAGLGVPVDGTWGLAAVALAASLFWTPRMPRQGAWLGLLSALFFAIMVGGGAGLRSMIRYSSVNFPLWAGLAYWASRRRAASWVLAVAWLAMGAVLTIRCYMGLWVQ